MIRHRGEVVTSATSGSAGYGLLTRMRHPKRGRAAQVSAPSVKSTVMSELDILSVGGEGDGVADGPVYAPFALPGERVQVSGLGERRELEAVLRASAERIVPACPHFGVCGGCALQHWEHGAYLAWKLERLRGTLALQRIETEILSPFAAGPGAAFLRTAATESR